MNLVNSILSRISESDIARVASHIGESADNTTKGVKTAVPAMLHTLCKATGTPESKQALYDAIRAYDDNALDEHGNLNGAKLLQGSTLAQTAEKANDLVDTLVGKGEIWRMRDSIAAASGVKSRPAESLLGFTAPGVFGSLKRLMAANVIEDSPEGLSNLLSEQQPSIEALLPWLDNRSNNSGAADTAGSTHAQNQTTARPANVTSEVPSGTTAAARRSADSGWLYKIVAPLLLLGALFIFCLLYTSPSPRDS